MLSGDSGSERRPQKLVQRMAGAEQAGEKDSGKVVSDVEDELSRERRERHG